MRVRIGGVGAAIMGDDRRAWEKRKSVVASRIKIVFELEWKEEVSQ